MLTLSNSACRRRREDSGYSYTSSRSQMARNRGTLENTSGFDFRKLAGAWGVAQGRMGVQAHGGAGGAGGSTGVHGGGGKE